MARWWLIKSQVPQSQVSSLYVISEKDITAMSTIERFDDLEAWSNSTEMNDQWTNPVPSPIGVLREEIQNGASMKAQLERA